MYVQSYIVASSHNRFHRNAKILSPSMAVSIHVTVNNIQVFSNAMEMQKWVPSALLSSYEIFHTV